VPAQHDDFAEFYEASYGRMVALVAAIVGDRSQAEDIAQEAFSRALTRWQRVARYDLPEAWVRKVALRLTIDATRRTRHNPHQPGLGLRVLNVTAPGNLLQASRLIVSYSRYCMATAACQDGQLITADGSKVLVTKVLPGGPGLYGQRAGIPHPHRTGPSVPGARTQHSLRWSALRAAVDRPVGLCQYYPLTL
jgi:Sigma-70 region 2